MTPALTVRKVRPEEHADLATLTVGAYQDLLGDAMDGDYRAELTDVAGRASTADVLVAVDTEGHVLGGVTYLPGPGPLAPFAGADEAVIRYLAVVGAAQGRGVGAALVAACVERARAGGRVRLSLHTTARMTAAQRLYSRAGFRRDPARDRVLESGLMLLGYVLDLRH